MTPNFRMPETTLARYSASFRLSPSSTNCKMAAIWIFESEEERERKRRVSPPPGIKGIEGVGSVDVGIGTGPIFRTEPCEGLNVYLGSWERRDSGDDSRLAVPSPRSE